MSVAKEDLDALQILWVEDVNSHDLPRLITLRYLLELRSECHLAHFFSMPYCITTWNNTVSFVDQLVQSIYVDDLTSGANTEEEAQLLAMKARELLAQAGFNL